jgi:serine protease Do
MRRWFVFLPLVLLLTLPSCANVKQAEDKASIEVPENAKTVPLRLKRVTNEVKRGTVIGEVRFGLLCLPAVLEDSDLLWGTSRGRMDDREFSYAFRDELRGAGYDVVNAKGNMFDDEEEEGARARLAIGAEITEIKANVCFPKSGWGSGRMKGDSYAKVRWQVYDHFSKSVVYETTTEGSANTATSLGTTFEDIILAAFSKAARNLLADEGFYDLIVRTAEPADEKPQAGATKKNRLTNIPAKTPYRNGFQQNLEKIQDNVFIVRAGYHGHGSGFFIAPGWGLTNNHVTGNADEVGIKANDGKLYTAEVVARHRGRDVALLKIKDAPQPGIPMKLSLPKAGDDVIVVGAPATEKLASTVTKGIVSAVRQLNLFETGKQPFIQADVGIFGGNSGGPIMDKNGNVIGIAVARNTEYQSVNYFIPIADGLKWLNARYGGGGS